MKEINYNVCNLSRQKLANPFSKETLKERHIRAKTIDLKDNHEIEDMGNGYSRIKAIDKEKILK